MTSREYIAVALTIILGLLSVNTSARSWDVAVVIGREVQFFARNQTLTGQAQLAEAESLSGVAYDDVTRTMFFSDSSNNVSIFSTDLTDKNFTLNPLLDRRNKSCILGIAFDTRTRQLFWSDALQGVIMKMHVPVDGPAGKPIVLHDLANRSPRGIALDVCNSHIYWVNSNYTNPSIERSNLDGSERITVIKERLHEPLAVAVDRASGKLYWIDDVEGIRIKIERSNLDGSDREMVVHPKRHQPLFLAVDHESIYWSDVVHRAIWTFPKEAKGDMDPIKFHSYQTSNQDADPNGIVTRDNVGKIDCAAIAKIRQINGIGNNSTSTQTIESYNNLITSTEESESTTENSKHCLNDGHVDGKNGTCRCKLGFAGAHCEINLCHNYCLQGSCIINSHGSPKCECNGTFSGPRCETDLCKDYCLHDGQCSVQNGKPICKCKYSDGSRCESLYNSTEICELYCTNSDPVPTSIATKLNCRCSDANQETIHVLESKESDEYKITLLLLGVCVLLLLVVILVLSFYVNKFRRRPRIKKRFVVNKGGVTPLTSRPQLPDSQCEITIENCCNMNICETPCFEPKLRTAAPSNNGTKKEEKNSLLDNMEQNSW